MLELALREALQLGHTYIGTEHILLGLVREGEGIAAQVLQKLGADLNRVRQTVIQLLSGSTVSPAETSVSGEAETSELAEEVAQTTRGEAPTCPNCFAVLAETLAIKVVQTIEAPEAGEPEVVNVAYCRRCGVALGTVT